MEDVHIYTYSCIYRTLHTRCPLVAGIIHVSAGSMYCAMCRACR